MAWFKRILLDGENPPPEVQTYVCGKDEWESWNQFPVPVSEYRTLYLDAAGAKKEDAYRLGDTLAEITRRSATGMTRTTRYCRLERNHCLSLRAGSVHCASRLAAGERISFPSCRRSSPMIPSWAAASRCGCTSPLTRRTPLLRQR